MFISQVSQKLQPIVIIKDEPVFIIIYKKNISSVVSAIDYQRDALNNYINIHREGIVEYNPSQGIRFKIGPFDKTGLKGEYNDFYYFIRDNSTKTIISRNKDKLRGFSAFRNRLINF